MNANEDECQSDTKYAKQVLAVRTINFVLACRSTEHRKDDIDPCFRFRAKRMVLCHIVRLLYI